MKVREGFFTMILIAAVVLISGSCEKIGIRNKYDKVVLLYLAANNNLSSYALDNVIALKEGFLPSVNDESILLVYKHISGHKPELVRLFKDQNGVAVEDVVAVYEDHNSATPEILKGVLNKMKAIFPADEYGLILWSHATGWLPKGLYGSSKAPGAPFTDPYASIVKSFGEDRGVEMEITELKQAIPYKLDFLIFDCCFMGGVEVAYELRNSSDYIMAAPTEILATGFPYNKVIRPLFEYETDLEEVANIFYQHYAPADPANSTIYNSATIALYDTDGLEEFADICEDIFSTGRAKMAEVNRYGVQPYYRFSQDYFFDIDDYISRIATPAQLLSFRAALDEVVVVKWTTDKFLDIPIKHYSGVSVYIPETPSGQAENFYKTLAWNQKTKLVN